MKYERKNVLSLKYIDNIARDCSGWIKNVYEDELKAGFSAEGNRIYSGLQYYLFLLLDLSCRLHFLVTRKDSDSLHTLCYENINYMNKAYEDCILSTFESASTQVLSLIDRYRQRIAHLDALCTTMLTKVISKPRDNIVMYGNWRIRLIIESPTQAVFTFYNSKDNTQTNRVPKVLQRYGWPEVQSLTLVEYYKFFESQFPQSGFGTYHVASVPIENQKTSIQVETASTHSTDNNNEEAEALSLWNDVEDLTRSTYDIFCAGIRATFISSRGALKIRKVRLLGRFLTFSSKTAPKMIHLAAIIRVENGIESKALQAHYDENDKKLDASHCVVIETIIRSFSIIFYCPILAASFTLLMKALLARTKRENTTEDARKEEHDAYLYKDTY